MERSTTKRLQAFNRRALEYLAKRGTDDDVENLTDEELVEAIYDIYPKDAILSMQFGRNIPRIDNEEGSLINDVPLYFTRTSIDVLPIDLHWF